MEEFEFPCQNDMGQLGEALTSCDGASNFANKIEVAIQHPWVFMTDKRHE